MNAKTKRITANLPADLLKEASDATGQGITETIIEGLKLVRRTKAYTLAQQLKGKVNFDFDVTKSRERNNS